MLIVEGFGGLISMVTLLNLNIFITKEGDKGNKKFSIFQ